MRLIMIMMMIFIATILPHIHCQPKCLTASFPLTLPLPSHRGHQLDLTNYFQGPNITLQAYSPPQIQLSPKYTLQHASHRLGSILSVSSSPTLITMLGQGKDNKYHIYYARVDSPEQITAIPVTSEVRNCVEHCLAPNGKQVLVTCVGEDGRYALVRRVLEEEGEWDVMYSKRLVDSVDRKVLYLSNDVAAVAISNPANSYIQLWDLHYSRILDIYDRTFLSLPILNIIDLRMEPPLLYLLDYSSKIYQLHFSTLTHKLTLSSSLQLYSYTKIAIHHRSLLITKRGTIAQLNLEDNSIFKYEVVGDADDQVVDLSMSLEYIVVLMGKIVVVYLRGVGSPYIVRRVLGGMRVCGGFLADASGDYVQVSSPVALTDGDSLFEIVSVEHAILSIPKSQQSFNISIVGTSRLSQLSESCSINFTVAWVQQNSQQIFDSGFNHSYTEYIYMNRPGRAELDLSLYGSGPNLQYQIQPITSYIDFSTQIHKQTHLKGTSFPEKIPTQSLHYSHACFQSARTCPLILLNQAQPLTHYLECQIDVDFYNRVTAVNCSEKKRELRVEEYVSYHVTQCLDRRYVLYVGEGSRNGLTLLRVGERAGEYVTEIVGRMYIAGNNTYHQNNITQATYNCQSNQIHLLLKNRKTLQIYTVSESEQISPNSSINLKLEITVQSLHGIFFNPRRFRFDSQGDLWVENYDQILILRVQDGLVSVKGVVEPDVPSSMAEYLVLEESTGKQRGKIAGYRYLVIADSQSQRVHVCAVNIYYQIFGKTCSNLPLLNHILPQSPKMQDLGNGKLSLQLFSQNSTNKYIQIYNLLSLSTHSSPYLSIPLSSNTSLNAFLHLSGNSPILLSVTSLFKQGYSLADMYAIDLSPSMTFILSSRSPIFVPEEIALLTVRNEEDSLRHSLNIGISNYPENLTKGSSYHYKIIERSVYDGDVQINTRGWFVGNVLTVAAYEKEINTTMIHTLTKITKTDKIPIGGTPSKILTLIRRSTPEVAVIKQNMVYMISPQTHQISHLLQITPSPTDQILEISYNSQYNILVALVMNEESTLSLVTFSMVSEKGFPLDTLILPESIQFVYDMEYKGSIIVVADFDDVLLVSVDGNGRMYGVDLVTEDEVGGYICYAELLHLQQQNYSILVSLCDTGLHYMHFTLDSSYTSLKISNKQTIDLKSYLHRIQIRLPIDAAFRKSITTLIGDGDRLEVVTLVSGFNSLIWELKMANEIVVIGIEVKTMLHRFGDFGVREEYSVEGGGRYAVLGYYGLVNGEAKHIHAVYDLWDVSKNEKTINNYTNCYIMDSLISDQDLQAQFLPATQTPTLVTLSHSKLHIQLHDVKNSLRVLLNDVQQIHTTVLTVSFSGANKLSIEIVLRGIDDKEWEVWQILLIVVISTTLVGIAVYVGRVFYGHQEQKKKLVPLVMDYVEYEEYEEIEGEGVIRKVYEQEELEKEESKAQGSQDMAINQSIRDSVPN